MLPLPRPIRFALILLCVISPSAIAEIQISTSKTGATINIDGELFTKYNIGDVPRPFFYPVIGPNGKGMTRNFPMKEGVKGEESDHKHHRGVWYGHHDVNGHDFWGEKKTFGKIVHKGFHNVRKSKNQVSFETTDDWVSAEGDIVCTDNRQVTIYDHSDFRIMDFVITFNASHGALVLGDEKDAGMAARVPHTMRVEREDDSLGEGHILMESGFKDKDAWGKKSSWIYYSGPVEGQQAGMAIFDHPKNPRFPTWWHARPYGLVAANPFGKRHFEELKDHHAGDFKIAKNDSVTFRYRILWNKGILNKEQLNAEFRKFTSN